MNAVLVTRFKNVTDKGDIIELVVWRLPAPVPPCRHSFKYRAAYIVDGVRVVGFDNERGKGDHRHIEGVETPFTFTTLEATIEEFMAEVRAARTRRRR